MDMFHSSESSSSEFLPTSNILYTSIANKYRSTVGDICDADEPRLVNTPNKIKECRSPMTMRTTMLPSPTSKHGILHD